VNPEDYDDIIIGGGKAGKTLAPALVAKGWKTARVERSLTMIGGGCIQRHQCLQAISIFATSTRPSPAFATEPKSTRISARFPHL
jgi:pyruvate/2-oxoglutarate dehydrogenase complex dihydrolipoamide dehydrogenase (E3) component